MGMSEFNNKTVIITGASAGVGAACARTFAGLGANLVLVARGQKALTEIENELSKITQVLAVAMDVSDVAACSGLIQQAVERFGVLHVLINNAGLHRRGNVVSRAPQDLVDMVDVDLRAPLQLTAEALPHIRKAGSGAIVMVGSLAGRAPLQGAATYAATKAGLRAFTYSLADELRDTCISVGVVSPGPIDTGFIMDEIDEVEDIVYSQPMSSAQQVADAVVRLAQGERVEIAMPWFSGKLTTLSYLFPSMRRASRGLLYKMGRKNKEKYRNR
jgi:short-subunit dehydrogenase